MSVPSSQKSHKRGMKGDTVNVRRSVRVKTKVPWIPPGKSPARNVGCKWEVGSFLVGLPSPRVRFCGASNSARVRVGPHSWAALPPHAQMNPESVHLFPSPHCTAVGWTLASRSGDDSGPGRTECCQDLGRRWG